MTLSVFKKMFIKKYGLRKIDLEYRSIFDKFFPNCDKFIHVWKNGCRAGGASWGTGAYTRAGLVDVQRLKKGHGLGDQITV